MLVNDFMTTLGQLRFICDGDLELMRSWRNSPAVRLNMYTRHEISIKEHLDWWERTKIREDQKYFMYEKDSQPLGIVGFMQIEKASCNCSWAFYAAPDAPKGTGSRMEFLALEYAFFELNLEKLYCEVLAFNLAVIKLHQKFGFQIEGVFRQHHRFEDKLVDIYRLGLLINEWKGKREEMYNKLVRNKKDTSCG
jgi:UDP-4-amino-4,6-dideoxy-N-acetyl-beta-L-altrosamine N-acetyltransferase